MPSDAPARFAPVLVAGALACAVGCGEDRDTAAPCRVAVVTDIDETLTTSDEEWIAQILDPAHDPSMRPDADTLMRGYADLGYTVVYVTARDESGTLSDGRTVREATGDWLEAHGFPWRPEDLHLSPDSSTDPDDIVAYKAGVLETRVAQGWGLAYGYGNATTDIDAFLQGGLPPDRVFLVGALAGSLEVGAIPDADAYTAHVAAHLPGVAEACAGPGGAR